MIKLSQIIYYRHDIFDPNYRRAIERDAMAQIAQEMLSHALFRDLPCNDPEQTKRQLSIYVASQAEANAIEQAHLAGRRAAIIQTMDRIEGIRKAMASVGGPTIGLDWFLSLLEKELPK